MAHWIEVDGVRLPKPLGGHPALDFCNTWAGWDDVRPGEGPGGRREWLPTYDVLLAWSRSAGLVEDGQAGRAAAAAARRGRGAAVLADAHTLRTAVHDTVLDPRASGLATVAEAARRAARWSDLATVDDRNEAPVGWRFTPEVGAELPLLAIARAAAGLLTSPAVRSVKACPGHDCGWLFLDTRGRRRWCSMAACGNRAKVAAHARRHA